ELTSRATAAVMGPSALKDLNRLRMGNPPVKPTRETVPRSPDNVKCSAATPVGQVRLVLQPFFSRPSAHTMVGFERNGVCDAKNYGRVPDCHVSGSHGRNAGERAGAGVLVRHRHGAAVQGQ